MKTPYIVALAVGIPFSMAVAGVAAHHVEVERTAKGAIDHWSESSCNNRFFGTDCRDGRNGMKFAHFKSGEVVDISALVDDAQKDALIRAWADSKGEKTFEAGYKKSLVDILVPSKNKAYYAVTFKPAP